MRVMILRSRLIDGQVSKQGDVLEVDDALGRSLIHSGGALRISRIGPVVTGDEPADSVELRQAVLNPSRRKTRKAD